LLSPYIPPLIFFVNFVGNKKDKAKAHCRARPHNQGGRGGASKFENANREG
jgi:hypothetical protein